MRYKFSISLGLFLLFVFTTITTNTAWACGKSNSKKEVKCSKECCKKKCKDSKNKKKNCCGDDCCCPASVTSMAELPKQFQFNYYNTNPIFFVKNTFFYKKFIQKFTIQDIWQPPITALFVW
jgi:hypothetical protein